MKKEEQNEKKKLTLREKLKDKREKAKIELIIYVVFFVTVAVFARVLGEMSNNSENKQIETYSFIHTVNDNYAFNTFITINENTYEYYGKVLGNNGTINLKTADTVNTYSIINKKYYTLEENNYILTNIDEVYPYIDYRYLNINNIKAYMSIGQKENSTYKINVSDLILNSESEEYITININEEEKNILIDYTPLLKMSDKNMEKVEVNITYYNINEITSLEE